MKHVKGALLRVARGLLRNWLLVYHFDVALRIIIWLLGKRWVQRLYFADFVANVRAHLHLLDGTNLDPEKVVQYHLLAKLVLNRWEKELLLLDDLEAFEARVEVTGIHYLNKARASGEAIIIARAHVVLGHIIPHWLTLNGFTDQAKIGRLHEVLPELGLERTKLREAFVLAGQWMEAEKTLGRGGVVHILPDGFKGRNGVKMPFLQQHRVFRSGFADLALKTKAVVVPAFIGIDLKGQTSIRFLKPLEVATEDVSPERRVTHLIEQYVNLLELQWQTEPWVVEWDWVSRHYDAHSRQWEQ